MSITRGYLFHLYLNQTTNGAGLVEDQVNGGTDLTSITLAAAPQSTAFDADTASLSVDPHKQAYFFVSQQAYNVPSSATATDIPAIYSGSTSTGAPNGTALVDGNFGINDYDYQTGGTILINDTAVDQASGRLYFTRDYEVPLSGTRGIDKAADNAVYSGLYFVPESGGTPIAVATGFSNPDAIALDVSQGFAFITDSTGVGYSGDQTASRNVIDVVNLATGQVSNLGITQTYHPDAILGTDNYGGNVLDGVAVDPATNTLYFTQSNGFNILPSDAYADTNFGIYKATYTIAGGTVTLGSVTTLYSGAGTHDPGRIAIDPADGVFYVVGNTPSAQNGPTGYGLWEGSLSSVNGTQLTAVDVPAPSSGTEEFGYTTSDVPGDANAALDVAPTVNAGSTIGYNNTGGSVATDAGLTTSSTTSSYYVGGGVSITGGFKIGDVLTANTTATTIAATYNLSSGVLTLSGADTQAHYQRVLASVTYSSTNSNPTANGADNSRTLAYSVYDGIATGMATSTVTIEQPAAVAAGSPSVAFIGGGSAVAVDPALTIAQGSSATLALATIAFTSGLLSGDTLLFTSQNGISGSYDSNTGILTLTGSALVANYQAAIQSVAFDFAPDNGNPTAGIDTSRTLSYTVSDGTGASSPVSSTMLVVHAPPTVSAGGAEMFVRGSAAVATDPGLTLYGAGQRRAARVGHRVHDLRPDHRRYARRHRPERHHRRLRRRHRRIVADQHGHRGTIPGGTGKRHLLDRQCRHPQATAR